MDMQRRRVWAETSGLLCRQVPDQPHHAWPDSECCAASREAL